MADELPASRWARNARLLRLPLGAAARATESMGRRLTGTRTEQTTSDARARAAEQLFTVLGELKGGAMKFGQALSLFEAALPEDIAGPYREQLRRLQDQAPPMPLSRVHAVLARELGPHWRDLFDDFGSRPAAAASIGQVHKAVWRATGQPVAVKVQYPGADVAIRNDLTQLGRLARLARPLTGSIEVGPLMTELAERITEEVDYGIEAASQAAAAAGFADSDEFFVPQVLTHTSRVIVSEWLDGQNLITSTTMPAEERNRWGLAYVRFLFSGPRRVGLLHGDPHPGNFKMMADGRLGVIDFGLVSRMPDGLPPTIGRLLAIAIDGNSDQVAAGLRREGFIGDDIDAGDLLDFLSPFIEPARSPLFHFHREWMQGEFARIRQASGRGQIATRINLPPDYLLIHRVWLGGIAVLSQMDVHADFATVLRESLPGFTSPAGG